MARKNKGPYFDPVTGEKKCGFDKRSGGKCKNDPEPGRDRCRLHGGRTPCGMAHYNAKHMRYSKHLPPRLRERIVEASADPDLLSARAELEIQTARIGELLEKLETGENAELWKELKTVWKEVGIVWDGVERAKESGDIPGLRNFLNALGPLIKTGGTIDNLLRRGASTERVWQSLDNAIHSRNRTSEVEQKRLVQLHQVITAERLYVMIQAVIDSVVSVVTDETQRRQIVQKIALLVNWSDGKANQPGGLGEGAAAQSGTGDAVERDIEASDTDGSEDSGSPEQPA